MPKHIESEAEFENWSQDDAAEDVIKQEAERPIANVADVIDFFDEHFIVIAVGFDPPERQDVRPAPQEQNDHH